jgi:CubicO group peptidase (beta-lactamase class C family)
MRLIPCSFLLAILATSIFTDGARSQPRGSGPRTMEAPKTRLEARTYSGGDLDSSFPWVKNLAVASGERVYFRWRSSEPGVTSAYWEVTNSPAGFSGAASIVAAGEIPTVPQAGQLHEFSIDFKTFSPSTAPNTPKAYRIRVTPRRASGKLASSLPVTVTHAKPGAQPVILDFSIDRFEQNLKARLAGKVTGYAYAIYRFDSLISSGAGGHAVLPLTPHSADRRGTTLSMSKTITAAAVMRAMEQMRAQGVPITIDSTISRYLPSNWKLGPHVNEITFRKLLTHKSGLRPAEVDPDSNDPDTFINLRQAIQYGATDANFANPEGVYANLNFCLFRIIIPYMISTRATLKAAEVDIRAIELLTGQRYVGYVQEHVLKPIGLTGISVVPTGAQPFTRYYRFGQPTVSFTDPTDDTAMLRTGAGYWHMSVKEYGKFISSLRHHGRIISSQSFKLMADNNLGMYAADSIAGKSWEHNGGYTNGAGAGSITAWMAFSNGVVAVIFANSQGGPVEAPQEVIRMAFYASL